MKKFPGYPNIGQLVLVTLNDGTLPAIGASAIVASITPKGDLKLLMSDPMEWDVVSLNTSLTMGYQSYEAAYLLSSKVRNISTTYMPDWGEEVQTLIVEAPRTVKKIQRRNYFRQSISLPIRYSQVFINRSDLNDPLWRQAAFEEWGVLPENRKEVASTNDVSGAGLSLVSMTPMGIGSLIFLQLLVPGFPKPLAGRVVHNNRTRKGDVSAYLIGVEFIDVEESEQDQIIKMLFKEYRRITQQHEIR